MFTFRGLTVKADVSKDMNSLNYQGLFIRPSCVPRHYAQWSDEHRVFV